MWLVALAEDQEVLLFADLWFAGSWFAGSWFVGS